MKKLLALFLSFLIALPSFVFADGGIWRYYQDRWEPLSESEQKAAINYQDGLEKMIIDVNFQAQTADKTVWIFPVPSKPEKVVIDILTNFPQLYGRDPVQEAKNSLSSLLFMTTITQIYPILFLFYFIGFAPFSATTMGGVTVHETIQKEGITTEIVTAETSDSLYNHIAGKGLNIDKSAISIFDNYVGKNYSFVVSWVSGSLTSSQCDRIQYCCYSQRLGIYFWSNSCSGFSYESYGTVSQVSPYSCDSSTSCQQRCTGGGSGVFYKCGIIKDNYCCCAYDLNSCTYYSPYYQTYPNSKQLGIFITFPTDKIYYPLLPTSIYGSTKIPITIYVLDYVEPETYKDISSYVKSSYYTSSYTSTSGLESFFGNIDTQNLKYTKIEILDAPSKYFTDDLWFKKGAPIYIGLSSFIAYMFSRYSFATGILFLLLISALVGAIAGLLVFKNWKKYALIGLANIFSIIAVAIVVYSTETRKIDENLREKLKQQGFSVTDTKKRAFVIAYTLIYVGTCIFLYAIISAI